MECVPREQGATGHDEEVFGVDLRKEPIWALVNGDLGGWPPHDYRDRDEAIPVRSVTLECEPDVLLGRSFVCGSGSIGTLIGLQRQSGTRQRTRICTAAGVATRRHIIAGLCVNLGVCPAGMRILWT